MSLHDAYIARHSGILPPPPPGMGTFWLRGSGLSPFWLRTPPPFSGHEHFLADGVVRPEPFLAENPPPSLGMNTFWLMGRSGLSTFWMRTPPPPPSRHERFLAEEVGLDHFLAEEVGLDHFLAEPAPVNRRTETLKTLPSHHTSYVRGNNSSEKSNNIYSSILIV